MRESSHQSVNGEISRLGRMLCAWGTDFQQKSWWKSDSGLCCVLAQQLFTEHTTQLAWFNFNEFEFWRFSTQHSPAQLSLDLITSCLFHISNLRAREWALPKSFWPDYSYSNYISRFFCSLFSSNKSTAQPQRFTISKFACFFRPFFPPSFCPLLWLDEAMAVVRWRARREQES